MSSTQAPHATTTGVTTLIIFCYFCWDARSKRDANSQLSRCSLKTSPNQCTIASTPAYLCHHALDPQLQLWCPVRGQDYTTEEWGRKCAITGTQQYISDLFLTGKGETLTQTEVRHSSALNSTKDVPFLSFHLPPVASQSAGCPCCSPFFKAFSLLTLSRMFKPHLETYANSASHKSLTPLPF